MASYRWLFCVCYCINLFSFSITDNDIDITSNVTVVSQNDSYSLTCRSTHETVDFYCGESYIKKSPCLLTTLDPYGCIVTSHRNATLSHQLIILSANHAGTVIWRCRHSDNQWSRNVSIKVTANDSAKMNQKHLWSSISITVIVSQAAVCCVLLLVVLTFIAIFIKRYKKQPAPNNNQQIPVAGRYTDLANTNTIEYKQLHIYENTRPCQRY
ncbi:hypothetical protein SNE40_005532 [Patella caerulea]|uniref:Immunoglobulin subtype domain-containing protein n=1 Tax=Patella caerulea TaxID=87958 RepID=A0AAN8Q041_PATCE